MVTRARLQATIEPPFTTMSPVRVGPSSGGDRAPSAFVTVEMDGAPVLRIDVYEGGPAAHPFDEVLIWAGLVVIGFGDHVHFVSIERREAKTFRLEWYFGHVYPIGDRLLVADAQRLHCFVPTGDRLWSSSVLGVDGVLVNGVVDDVIEGSGEWDPPGGWAPFRVRLSSGEVLAGAS